MIVSDPGHIYRLQNNKGTGHASTLVFFKDPEINGSGHAGTTNQEVLRALIDRVKFLDDQVPSDINKEIIKHLRYAIALHEMRHLYRMVEKGDEIEFIKTMPSHFIEIKRNDNA